MIYLCSVNGEIHIMRAKVPEKESSVERKFPRTFGPGSESSRE